VLKNSESFTKFAKISLEQAIWQSLPLLKLSFNLFSAEQDCDFEKKFARIDEICDAFLTNEVSKRASISQGLKSF